MEGEIHGTQGSQAQDGETSAEGKETQVQGLLGDDGSDSGTGGDGAGGTSGTAGGSDSGDTGKTDGNSSGSGAKGASDFEAMIASRDKQIEKLRAQIAEASRQADAAEKLGAQIEELKAEAANERMEFALQMAGCRNIKAAKALMDEYEDVEALKADVPWMFEDAKPSPPKGKTGLSPAGAASEENATLKHWRKLAGLDDEE